jgi:putative PIN family toxin of toxin-antitoxin system
LQLIVSDEILAEYLEVLSRLQVEEQRIHRLVERLQRRDTVTHVSLGPRFAMSCDPDDNLLLATAVVGKAKFLITNDRDLLDIAMAQRRKFKFEIVTPQEFLARLAE